MNEQIKQTNGTAQDEVLQALIGKVIDLGARMHDNTVQLKKMADRLDVQNAANDNATEQGRKMEQLIKTNESIDAEVKKISQNLDLPTQMIDSLKQQLQEHQKLFERPLQKTVHHRHFLGWPIIVIACLFIITCASVTFGISQYRRIDRYMANDTKWRNIKLSKDSLVYNAVKQTADDYLSNPDRMLKDVEAEELRREELAAEIEMQRQTQQNIEELKRKEKRR